MQTVRRKINYWTAPYIWRKKSATRVRTIWEDVQKPFFNHVPRLTQKEIITSFVADNRKWEHREFIKELSGDLTIDPRSGFVIDNDGFIIRESIVFDHYGCYPDKLALKTAKNVLRIPEVILFDHYWSENYFHFYSDVLPKLFLIRERFPEIKDFPLIVSEKISKTRQFRFFMKFNEIAGFNWLIQNPQDVIKTQKCYILQPMPYAAANWQRVKELAKDYLNPLVPDKRIFINRPRTTGRHIANLDGILPILDKLGFQVEEMERKDVADQIALFSEASMIVSIHGAALANLAFCDHRCRVLEIMPDKRINTHYYWLSDTLGLSHYDCLPGYDFKVNRLRYPKGRFFLHPESLEIYLRKLTGQ